MNRAIGFGVLLLAGAAWALPLGSSARVAIPSDIQQIISVDYRSLNRNSGRSSRCFGRATSNSPSPTDST